MVSTFLLKIHFFTDFLIPVAPMPYTQIGPNGWPQFRQQTSDAEQVITSEGYTRATQLFPDSNSLENLNRPPSNLPSNSSEQASYIQFQSFGRSSPSEASQDSHSLTITPVATSPINKPPASAGYISVDEANKINQERSSELCDINPMRAYSRIAIPSSSTLQSNSSMISSSSPAALSAKDLSHPTADIRPNGSSKHTYV